MTQRKSAARERLSRERIVAGALAIMDREGLDAVSMRRVAHELGVEAMSLYNHIGDKDDLLDGICDMVMSEFQFPEPSQDWEEMVRAGARAWRDLLRSHPATIRLFAERKRPTSNARALRPMEFALGVLRQTGLNDDDTVQAFQAFGGYIQGSVMMEMNPLIGEDKTEHRNAHHQLADELPREEFPCLVDALPRLDACDPDALFEFGLDLMIAGLRARAAAPAS